MALVLTIDLGLFRQPGVEGVYDEDSGVDCTGRDAAGTHVPRTAEIQNLKTGVVTHHNLVGLEMSLTAINIFGDKTRSRCTRASRLRMQCK